ncbi:MAG: FAD-binding oxidoreductase [Candidatus Eremiobacteraeota bacterium]|nr:FAD-binding oxidoreductase [Candidatus Eremiobacteraeota bacterium]
MNRSRGSFLRELGGYAVAGAAGAVLLESCGSNAVPASSGSLPWQKLAASLKGPLLRPGSNGFAAAALPNNLRYASTMPSGIAMCETAEDVAASILWARRNGVPFAARCGGHSYAGYSTTTGLMIDLALMNGVTFDDATGIVTIGGGARNAHIFDVFKAKGIATTHGRCRNVGIAGFVLGGGIGFSMREHGLACDRLIASEIVLADGNVAALDAKHNADLFWACRGGGGGNFGINTSFSLQTFPVSNENLTAYDLYWTSNLEEVFTTLAAVLEAAPISLGCRLTVAPAAPLGKGTSGLVVELLGQFAGTRKAFLELLRPVYAIAAPSSGRLREEPYWQAQSILEEVGAPAYYTERSRFFDGPLDRDIVATIFNWMNRWPADITVAGISLFQMGGRVNAKPATATAFVHRNSSWLGTLVLQWDAGASSEALRRNFIWLNGFYEAVVPLAKGGAYQNFIDPQLVNWKTAYYGGNLARLEAIKRRVDPSNVFSFPQAIP